ncbi:formin-like protein 20 [Sarcophilus harrisii]|uniref:formin-like protein 20 n=1 Tax=Sarcophilus harrisii TaxID=9305 RepID=UPI001301D01F|nr:formin-like protein 20 [Sarcophilus harrisii]XP_031807075.1 formin-like protein 20 [Sarcophilus harrisii]
MLAAPKAPPRVWPGAWGSAPTRDPAPNCTASSRPPPRPLARRPRKSWAKDDFPRGPSTPLPKPRPAAHGRLHPELGAGVRHAGKDGRGPPIALGAQPPLPPSCDASGLAPPPGGPVPSWCPDATPTRLRPALRGSALGGRLLLASV